MKYTTTNKAGDSVVVSEEMRRKLIQSGKKTEGDFQEFNEDLAELESETERTAEIERLRLEGQDLANQASYLSENPQMQPEQISGIADAAGVGLARFMFPQASRVAERGGSRDDILKSSAIETPNLVASAISPSMSVGNALRLGTIGAGTSYASRKSTGDEISPEEMGLAATLPMLPTVGSRLSGAIGRTAKEIAPNVLHSTVVPKSGVMKGANPPDFEFALQQKNLIPKKRTVAEQIGGFERNLDERISSLSKERAAIPAWKEGQVDVVNEAFINATDEISKVKASPMEEAKLFNALEDLQKSYARKYGDETLNIETAMSERSALGRESGMFEREIDDSPAMKKVKSIVRGEIGKLVKQQSPEVMEKTAEMAPFMALARPVENAADLSRGKTIIPLGMTQAMMTGAMTGGLPGAAVGLGAHQLVKTPYGAQRLYNVGEFLSGQFPKTGRAARVVTGSQSRSGD